MCREICDGAGSEICDGTPSTLLFIHVFERTRLDWLQSPVTKYVFLIILFNNPLEQNQNNIMTLKRLVTLVTSLYSHDMFGCILKDYQPGL